MAATPPVVLIVMENHSLAQLSAANAPYLFNTFNLAGRSFTAYKAIEHPSLPNYLDITGGGNQGCTVDTCPTESFTANNYFRQVTGHGRTWALWAESMTTNCKLTNNQPYVVHHNPAAYWLNIEPACNAQDTPYPATLPSTLASFTFISPNNNDNMHTGSITAGDTWLSVHVPPLLAMGAVVIITFDEGTTAYGQVVYPAEVGPGIPAGVVDSASYNHYSLLAGLEDYIGARRLGNAVGAVPLPI